MEEQYLEIIIHQRLQKAHPPHKIADDLMRYWTKGELSLQGIHTVCQFLIHFGLWRCLLERFLVGFRCKELLSWVDLFFVWDTLSPDSLPLDDVLVCVHKEGQIQEMFMFVQKIQVRDAESTWIGQLDLRPILRKKDPAFYHLKPLFSEERSAQEVDIYYEPLVQSLLRCSTSQNASVVATSLYMMGAYRAAAETLDQAPQHGQTPAFVGLRLEIKLKQRHFLEMQSEWKRLDTKQPDMVCLFLYCQAQALWGLCSYRKAIVIMHSIVKKRPYYRSACDLLNEWRQQLRHLQKQQGVIEGD